MTPDMTLFSLVEDWFHSFCKQTEKLVKTPLTTLVNPLLIFVGKRMGNESLWLRYRQKTDWENE